MRLIRKLIVFVIIGIIGFYFLEKNDMIPNDVIEKVSEIFQEKKETEEIKHEPNIKVPDGLIEDDLTAWIGKSEDELLDGLGEPVRRDLSAYDYMWWVYTDEATEYVQFGINDHHVQTIYITGNESSEWIGQTYNQLNDQFSFKPMIRYRNGLSTYNFILTADDLQQHPIVKINDDTFIQFYFDVFLNELSSLRILTAEILLKHTPYEIEYRGELPEQPDLSDQEWEQIERGAEQQIFLMTNIIRHKHEKSQLVWEEKVKDVALSHSKDMFEKSYFSHDSLDGRSLKDRLEAGDISYQAAGENIAAQYTDGPAAVEGWLNSEGHREALLENEFTGLGVGVYRRYFTQNFIANRSSR